MAEDEGVRCVWGVEVFDAWWMRAHPSCVDDRLRTEVRASGALFFCGRTLLGDAGCEEGAGFAALLLGLNPGLR